MTIISINTRTDANKQLYIWTVKAVAYPEFRSIGSSQRGLVINIQPDHMVASMFVVRVSSYWTALNGLASLTQQQQGSFDGGVSLETDP
jgi:hypothetical protein